MKVHYPSAVLLALSLSACMGGAQSAGVAAASAPSTQTAPTSPAAPGAPANPAPAPPSTGVQRTYQKTALVFAGSGTWSSEVTSIENILTTHGASYQEVNSAQLDAMTLDELSTYGILVFPGGSGGTEADSLSAQTHANLRAAVQERGVGYVGFCAGAFIGEAPAPAPGGDVSYGLGIVDGPILDLWTPPDNPNAEYEMTQQSFADGTTKDILWYGGPITPGGTGVVVAKYPNGQPSISQIHSGKGFVILSGGHPTADDAILSALGLTSTDGTHLDLVWKLFGAALSQTPLPAF